MWAKQTKLNHYKCNSCGEISTFVGANVSVIVNIISIATFILLAIVATEYSGSWLGLLIPGILYLPLGYLCHLHNCKNKKLFLVKRQY